MGFASTTTLRGAIPVQMKILSGTLLVLGVMILALMITEAFVDLHYPLHERRSILAVAVTLAAGMITAAILIRLDSN
jgi:hypothetical protein